MNGPVTVLSYWCLTVLSEHCYGSITEELRGSLIHKWWSGTLLCDRIYPECDKYESKHIRQQSCPQLGYYSAMGPLWGAGYGLRVEMTFKQRWIRVNQS